MEERKTEPSTQAKPAPAPHAPDALGASDGDSEPGRPEENPGI